MKKLFFILLFILIALPAFSSDFTVSTAPTSVNTTSYDAFGDTLKIADDTVIHIYRKGTSHASDKGSIYGIKYTISTATWGSPYLIYTDPLWDVRDISLLEINNKIFLFWGAYDWIGGDHKSLGYLVSTDMTGTSWSSNKVLTTVNDLGIYTGSNFHPRSAVKTGVPGTYLVGFQLSDNTTYKERMFKTTDYGETWTDSIEIVSSVTKWVEGSIAYIGDNKLICLLRDNQTAGNYMGYTTSSDNGETWSAVNLAYNLGPQAAIKPPMIFYDEQYDDILVAYLNRGTDQGYPYDTMYYAWSNYPDKVFNDITSLGNPINLDGTTTYNNQCCGYNSAVRLNNSYLMMVWSREQTSSDTDIRYAIFRTGDDGMTFE